MRTRGIAALFVVLVLASCGGGDTETPAEPEGPARVEAGDCLDIGAGSRGLTELKYRTDALVDCAGPHGAEVVAVEPLPEDLLNRHSATT